jgi:Pentapeptide repeats (8 copies)
MLQAAPIPQQFLTLPPEDLKQQFEKTSDIINSLVTLIIGFCFFCALALSGPDTKLLSTDPSIQLPFVQGEITFQFFLVIAPFALLILSVYVHIYVGYWWRLLRAQTQQALDAGLQPPPIWHPPLIFNLPTRLASATSVLVLYLVVPLTLLFFCYEALKLPQTPSERFGVIGFLSSLIKGGPRHSLSPASCVIPPSSFAAICFGFLLGRRVVEPHAHDWKRTASAYRNLFPFIALGVFSLLVIALVWPRYLWKFPLNLNNADLRVHDLSFLDLTYATMWNANLQGANLRKANLNGAYLDLSDLRSATLAQASFEGAYLRGTRLQGADLSDADFTNAYLTNSNLCATNSVRARFDQAKLAGAHWEYADLIDVSFKDVDGLTLTPSACLKDRAVVGKCCGIRCLKDCSTTY